MNGHNLLDDSYIRHCLGSLLDDSLEAKPPTKKVQFTLPTDVPKQASATSSPGVIGSNRWKYKPNCWPKPMSLVPRAPNCWPKPVSLVPRAPNCWPKPVSLFPRALNAIPTPKQTYMVTKRAPRTLMNGKDVVNGVDLSTLKFVKPAPQCFHWDDPNHKRDQPNCTKWHPRSLCRYHPCCRLTAEVCGFGHPFCNKEGYCNCEPTKRSLQLHHRLAPLHVIQARGINNAGTTQYVHSRSLFNAVADRVGEQNKNQ